MEIYNRLLTDLFVAYYDARRNKRNTINQLRFEINFESNLVKLCEDILNREYKIQPSICFIISNPVKREIFAADFRDRVIHHLIFNYISPSYEQLFIEDSYSCREKKGTHYGIRRIESFIRECSNNYTSDCYILKLDIQGYFMNIDRTMLLTMVEDFVVKTEIKNLPIGKDLFIYLIQCVLNDDPTKRCIVKGSTRDWEGLPLSKSLFHTPKEKGLPIGNLTSQLFSNVFLHVLDDYIKNTLKIKYYGRYVDDFIIIHKNKDFLLNLKNDISNFLNKELSLNIHPKKIFLQHYSKGVIFLGAMIKPHRIYISNRTKKQFINCIYKWQSYLQEKTPSDNDLQKMSSSINSYLGVMSHYRTYNIKKKILLNNRKNLLIYKYGYISVKPFKQMKYIIKSQNLPASKVLPVDTTEQQYDL